MSLFSNDSFTYKGYDITKDRDSGVWIIRTGGRYGVKVGEANDKAAAKRIVEGLK